MMTVRANMTGNNVMLRQLAEENKSLKRTVGELREVIRVQGEELRALHAKLKEKQEEN